MNDEMIARGNMGMGIGTDHAESDLGQSQRSEDNLKPEMYMAQSDRYEQPDFASMTAFNRESVRNNRLSLNLNGEIDSDGKTRSRSGSRGGGEDDGENFRASLVSDSKKETGELGLSQS